ncbi:MAG: SusC/RagA family TonB-linked outer membrane protein [Lentimicrobiaceae bacterium]|jgi:TonB-linked SusC/RagA family outer membrane protein
MKKSLLTNLFLQRKKNFYVLMKLKVIILLVSAFQISVAGNSQSTKLNLCLNNAKIGDVLKEIHKQSGYDFFYAHEVTDSDRKIDINLKDATVDDVLNLCSKSFALNYEIIDKVIVIEPKVKQITAPVQKLTVKGTVTSSEDGSTIPGVSVVVKGKNTGVVTDLNGNYSIEVIDANTVLVFSCVGFEPQEVIVGDRTSINIVLKQSIQELEGVIVSAIGTNVVVDQTGSTSSVVKSAGLIKSGETGMINALAGKASGVRIVKSNGDPGAGSAIQIRGVNTIAGASQPLVILDGIPISNENIGGVTISQQSRLDDINAKDIESMQILKGASAAALWGSRAANGVIVITTKNGKFEKKPEIQYTLTQSYDFISIKTPLQDAYGQGQNGKWSGTVGESWGDKISDRSGAEDAVKTTGDYFIANSGKIYYPITTKNSKETFLDSNWDQVFRTGKFTQHSISISGGGEKTTYYFSYENLNQGGIIRNYDYIRNNLRLNTQSKISNKVTWENKITYTNTRSNRIVQAGETTNGIMLGLLRSAPDFDMTDYIGTYVSATGTVSPDRQRTYRSQYGQSANAPYNNPLWTLYQQKAPDNVNRFIINPEIKADPTDWLKLIVRGGLDYYSDFRGEFYPKNSSSSIRTNGYWSQTDITSKEYNVDGLAIATKDISENLKLTATLGVNLNDRQRITTYNTISPFTVNSGLITTSLNPDNSSTSWNRELYHIRSNRGYGVVNFGIFNQLFVSFSGALEAASTIKGTFFYPSTDVAWQFTDLIKSDILSFGKLRFAWGKVGIQPAPYKFTTLASPGYADFGGSFTIDSEKGNENLKPEIKSEWEVGTNLRFFKNLLDLSITYYKNETKDILFAVASNPSSGYLYNYKNAATIQNKGFEIDFNAKIFSSGDFSASLTSNFNNNKNLVVDIAGADFVDIGGSGSTAKAIKGYPMSSFYLPGTQRNDDGSFVLNANGFPILSTASRVLGDPNPDWRGGVGLDMKWKSFDFSILFEHSQGGEYIDRTRLTLYGFGMHEDVSHEITLTEDLKANDGKVYTAGTTVRGNIVNFGAGNVLLNEAWYRTGIGGGLGFNKANDLIVQDATWTKLRNVTLGYALSAKDVNILSKLLLSSIRFSVTGRDLILWTKLVGVDPETNNYGVSNASGMNYFNNPATRSILFNLQVNF